MRTDGLVECWGEDSDGQSTPPVLAQTDGRAVPEGSDSQVSEELLSPESSEPLKFASVSAGDRQTCGVTTDGSVECWGDDRRSGSSPPGGTFASVSARIYHTCGVQD